MAKERKPKPGAFIEHKAYKAIKDVLSFEQKGMLLDALLDLSMSISGPEISADDLKTKDVPEYSGDQIVNLSFRVMGQKIIDDTIAFKNRSEKNAENASRKDNDCQPSQTTVNDCGGKGNHVERKRNMNINNYKPCTMEASQEESTENQGTGPAVVTDKDQIYIRKKEQAQVIARQLIDAGFIYSGHGKGGCEAFILRILNNGRTMNDIMNAFEEMQKSMKYGNDIQDQTAYLASILQ